MATRQTKPVYSTRLDADLIAMLKAVKERDGIPESEQIRRALRLWFEAKGLLSKARQAKSSEPRKR